MSDPNADVIGYTFTDEDGHECKVVRTVSWSNAYVEVHCLGPSITVRSAALVRRAKHLGHGHV